MRARIVALLGGALLAACSSGESILNAGNDPLPTTTTVAPGPPTSTGPTVPGETTTSTAAVTTTTTPLASLPPCPVDALDEVTAPVDITFWYGLNTETDGHLQALTEQYHASQDRVRVRLENQVGYRETIDKFVQSSQDSRPSAGHAARVRPGPDGRQRGDDPRRRLHRGQRVRHLGVPARRAGRVRDRRGAVVDAVQRQQPGVVLQRRHVRGGGARSGRSAGRRSRSCGRRRRRSSTRGPPPTGWPSTRARTRAAAGSSSSGWPRPARRTPTTATAAWLGRPACSTAARRVWPC